MATTIQQPHNWESTLDIGLLAYLISVTLDPLTSQLGGFGILSNEIFVLFLVMCKVFLTSFHGIYKNHENLGLFVLCFALPLLIVPQLIHFPDYELHKQVGFSLLFGFYFLADLNQTKIINSLGYFLFFFVAVISLLILLDPSGMWDNNRLALPFHANSTAATIAILSPFIWLNPRFPLFAKAIATALSLLVIIVACKSRTSMVIYAFLGALSLIQPWDGFRIRPIHFFIVFMLVCFYFIFPNLIKDSITRNQTLEQMASLTGRSTIWKVVFGEIERNLLFGVGGDGYIVRIWLRFSDRYWDAKAGAHNLWLGILLTQGLFALIGHIIICTYSLYILISRIFKKKLLLWFRYTRPIWVLAFIGLLVHAVSEANSTSIDLPIGVVWWACIAVALKQEVHEQRPQSGHLPNEQLRLLP